jgi:hypothetical protein
MTRGAGLLATWRRRLPVVAVVVACVAGIVAAVTGAANPVSAVQFLMPGHWVYNSALQSVFHVDGPSGNVDAQARVPGQSGDQVFQGDVSGYVVGSDRITEFGKSSLSVAEPTTPPAREKPVGVETVGGPYLVYQEAGTVVRLGSAHLVLPLGGPVGVPVATEDGTLWLPRTDAGLLCSLSASAENVSCSVPLPTGHAGALSVVGGRLVFVDFTAATVHLVGDDALGEPRDLGVEVGADARLAATDVAGRLVILDGARMHIVDAGLGTSELADPVSVDLDDGEYAGPVANGSVVAVVNRTTNTLVTYDRDGTRKQAKELPAENGDPSLTEGDDNRIYVDGTEGEHVVIVDEDGDLTDVPIGPEEAGRPVGGRDPDAPDPGLPGPVNPGPASPDPADADPGPTGDPRQNEDAPPAPEDPPPPPPPPPPPEVPASPPGAPTAVAATAGDATATVTWNAAPDNRSPITAYRIAWAGGETTVAAATRTAVIPGLANGTGYVFTVNAVNGIGAGPGAASNPVTPVAPVQPASAPLNLVVDFDTSTRQAGVYWDTPADLGGGTLAHYLVSVTGMPDTTNPDLSLVVPRVEASGTVTFTVRAVTTGPGGRQVAGAVVSHVRENVPAPGGGGGEVRLSRGADTQEYCSPDPDCAWMHVELVGMQPNTSYGLMPHSTHPDYENPGGDCTTDDTGYCVLDAFAYHEAGNTVWVVATAPDNTEIRSNDLYWDGEA